VDGVLLSEKTATQLIDALREYLKEPLQPRRTPRYANQFPGQTFKLAITTSTISAASGSTPGSGTATLQLFNGATYSAISATYASVTVFNSTSSTIPSGNLIQLKRIDGYWFVDVASC
jgi:hypothetical protein